jgi:hypothetical protein
VAGRGRSGEGPADPENVTPQFFKELLALGTKTRG